MANPLLQSGIAYSSVPNMQDVYEAGAKQGREEAEKEHQMRARRPGVVDDLKELLSTGDLIIRKVNNGFIIRRVPMHHGWHIETWVVEGDDIKAVGEQLTAIQATDAMKKPEVDRPDNSLVTGMSAMIDGSSSRAAKMLSQAVDSATLASIIARTTTP